MTASRDDILDWVATYAGRHPTSAEQEDLLGVFAFDGDDADELIEAFAADFGVRMDGFIWYFHHDDELPGLLRRVVPFGSNGAALPMIPVTIDLLLRSVQSGEWAVDYPEHRVSRCSMLLRFMAPFAMAVLGIAAIILLTGLWERLFYPNM